MPAFVSDATRDALTILGSEIAAARRRRRWTLADLAERAGVSRVTARRVERGEGSVAIGTVFEMAILAGVELFGTPRQRLPTLRDLRRAELALLPSRIHTGREDFDDDF